MNSDLAVMNNSLNTIIRLLEVADAERRSAQEQVNDLRDLLDEAHQKEARALAKTSGLLSDSERTIAEINDDLHLTQQANMKLEAKVRSLQIEHNRLVELAMFDRSSFDLTDDPISLIGAVHDKWGLSLVDSREVVDGWLYQFHGTADSDAVAFCRENLCLNVVTPPEIWCPTHKGE